MILGTATHFSQGWNTSMMGSAAAIGATAIRDSVSWAKIETTPGFYDFSDPSVAYVRKALDQGLDVTLVFSATNPLYDGGTTPNTSAGLAAYAKFVAATVQHFKGVSAIEIGNEFNGNNFVSGVVQKDSYSLRDDHYMDILNAVARSVSEFFPAVKILGGATHAIPVAYLTELFNKGALDRVDGVTIHPYTSTPEQLSDQLDVLKAAMGVNQTPIYVTEFGQNFKSLAEAPAYLVKMTAVMAAAGVASADWYALQEQKWFPNMELVDRAGVATPAGKAFAFIQNYLLALGTPIKISTDNATYGYLFGRNTLVIWGEDQTIKLTGPTTYYKASGEKIEHFDGKVHFGEPVIAISETPIVAGETFFSTGTGIVADSLHDFDVSNAKGSTAGFEGPWSYFQLSGTGVMTTLYTMPGGARADEPWTPYIGTEGLRPLRVDSTSVNPVDFGNGHSPSARYAVVERFTAKTADELRIAGHWDVSDKSADGADLTILHNGKAIYSTVIYDPLNGNVLDLNLEHIAVSAGDTIDFVLGTNTSNAGGDLTARRITILSEGPLATLPDDALPPSPPRTEIHPGVTLEGTAGNDVLTPLKFVLGRAAITAYDDTLYGRDGEDRLDGGAGADLMYGGGGNDTYTVDNVLDRTIEAAADGADEGGIDLVNASVDFTLERYVEKLTLTGTADINGMGNELVNTIKGNAGANILRGEDGADKLYGGEGSDQLSGSEGNDVLDGGPGADAMFGGHGNDTYTVDDIGDTVDERDDPTGIDLVKSSVSFALGTHVENLTLTGTAPLDSTGNALANKITGNTAANNLRGGTGDDTLSGGAGADILHGDEGHDILSGGADDDTLYGGAGNDKLDGGTGVDAMHGGAGNDSYVVDDLRDTVDESDDAFGIDGVSSSVLFKLGGNVENLTLTGTAAVDGYGNALANKIVGNAAANMLSGRAGNDTLSGGAGNDVLTGGAGLDVLTGGAGADTFVFGPPSATSTDKVTDFSSQSGDRLHFQASDFGLSVGHGLNLDGSLSSDYFEMVSGRSTLASRSHSEFLFNATSKTLFWDADGHASGVKSHAPVAIASFTVSSDIAAKDFLHASSFLFF
ncbi:Asl1-like glycosyl hydrolase catalytic domain-containing protein [Methylorubrum aminovorans]